MENSRAYLDSANIGDLELQYLADAIGSGEISTRGQFVNQFEKEMALYLGVPDAVATNSGTSALHLALLLALLAAGVGPGDEVILPTLTFVATANAVRYMGVRPVFVDVDRETWCLGENEIHTAITSNTKATIGVNLYGVPCDWFNIVDESLRSGLWLIEDAAESLGCQQRYENLTDFQCYSFNGNKIVTTGSGGLVVSRDLMDRKLLSQATCEDVVGYNYGMNNIQAALGLAQLKRMPEFLTKKRRFNEIYRQELDDIVQFQQATSGSNPSWWFTAAIFPESISIPQFMAQLRDRGIPTRRIFRPLHQWPIFQKFAKGQVFPNAEFIYEHGLCLPSSTLNSEEDIHAVCRTIREIL